MLDDKYSIHIPLSNSAQLHLCGCLDICNVFCLCLSLTNYLIEEHTHISSSSTFFWAYAWILVNRLPDKALFIFSIKQHRLHSQSMNKITKWDTAFLSMVYLPALCKHTFHCSSRMIAVQLTSQKIDENIFLEFTVFFPVYFVLKTTYLLF